MEKNNGNNENLGIIKISDEVVATIAANAASKTTGVVGMSSNLVDGFANILGRNSSSKGVKVDIKNNIANINLYIIVKYKLIIPDIALQVQKNVKTIIEKLTNFEVKNINIYIQGVMFDSDNENTETEEIVDINEANIVNTDEKES